MLSPEEAQAQALWFQEHWSKHVPFNVEMGLDIVKWEPGVVRARLPYADKLSAHDGIFHGGVLCSAIDTIGSGAVVAGHDFNLGNRFTTVALNVQFMAVAKGPEVIVEGTCIRRGRRLNFARGQVLSLEGEILAEGTLTVNASGQRPRVGTIEGTAH
ncbi:PaaI family thioesterase [Gordonia polyisoprenivorans]|uniref:PaaI family thioesterase n=1 Tax=Gordonia polyisoprenivorans TaxID=84595 RepID=UPI001AD659C3|nr:PaaI family thioesterase [Gordonia polyisoprenivorans]QTI70963.1 PaaI family thioesterase [Gordonia polyisoprenivorans]